MGANSNGVAQHVRHNHPRLAPAVDIQTLEGGIQFFERRVGLANQMDTYVDDQFAHHVDPKNSYPVRDCKIIRHCRLLEFIVPIIHSDKPTWVTITIGNTIFGALDEERPID